MHKFNRFASLEYKASMISLYQYFESEQYLFAFIQLSCIKYFHNHY